MRQQGWVLPGLIGASQEMLGYVDPAPFFGREGMDTELMRLVRCGAFRVEAFVCFSTMQSIYDRRELKDL